MKRWALLVAILYGAIVCLLLPPTYHLAFAPQARMTLTGIWFQRQWWLLLAVMALGQGALLAVPVRVASRRPVTHRPLATTVLAGATMMSALVIGAFCSIYEFGFHDAGGHWTIWTVLGLGIGAWCGWGWIFFRMSRMAEAGSFVSRMCAWLLRGSILELLIAVPTHIVARHRDYCCAGVMTFIGLTTGMSVMLFSFGPGVFFLLADRWRRLHPEVRSDAVSNKRSCPSNA
jgi:hypothetical protein